MLEQSTHSAKHPTKGARTAETRRGMRVCENGGWTSHVRSRLRLEMLPQPDDTTCGPTCLQAVYSYYGQKLSLDKVIDEVEQFPEGGTIGVLLGLHALGRGFDVTMHTFNLDIFDPTWFDGKTNVREKLEAQVSARKHWKQRKGSLAYAEFLGEGGKIVWQDLTPQLIIGCLAQRKPILTGLSATYLYQAAREIGDDNHNDDIRGEPVGHFVVLCGYDERNTSVMVADPYSPNPLRVPYYELDVNRVIAAILLGVLTYDGILLLIEPKSGTKSRPLSY